MRNAKTVAKIAATALFLILCVIIPSLFSYPAEPPTEPDFTQSPAEEIPLEGFADRAALFNANFNGVDIRGSAVDESDIDDATLKACQERLSFLAGELVTDERSDQNLSSFGSSFFTVSGDGATIRIARYYREWVGDWQNWLDIIFDADTGDLYYLRTSSECLNNHKKYPIDALPSPDALLRLISGYTGKSVYSGVTGNMGDDTVLTCNLSGDGSGIDYTYYIIGHHYYEDRTPARLYDYRIVTEAPDASLIRTVDENDATN